MGKSRGTLGQNDCRSPDGPLTNTVRVDHRLLHGAAGMDSPRGGTSEENRLGRTPAKNPVVMAVSDIRTSWAPDTHLRTDPNSGARPPVETKRGRRRGDMPEYFIISAWKLLRAPQPRGYADLADNGQMYPLQAPQTRGYARGMARGEPGPISRPCRRGNMPRPR